MTLADSIVDLVIRVWPIAAIGLASVVAWPRIPNDDEVEL